MQGSQLGVKEDSKVLNRKTGGQNSKLFFNREPRRAAANKAIVENKDKFKTNELLAYDTQDLFESLCAFGGDKAGVIVKMSTSRPMLRALFPGDTPKQYRQRRKAMVVADSDKDGKLNHSEFTAFLWGQLEDAIKQETSDDEFENKAASWLESLIEASKSIQL